MSRKTGNNEKNLLWRSVPPGPEQLELTRLFRDGDIGETDTANHVRNLYPMFRDYSARVFGYHFRKTKEMFHKKNSATSTVNHDDIEIPELCSNRAENHVGVKFIQKDEVLEEDDEINFFRAPKHIWTHTDTVSKCKFVNVAIPIISASQNINFSIAEDGMKIYVSYCWGPDMCDAQQLFAHEIGKNGVTPNDPKIHALATQMLEKGISEVSPPKAKTVVHLPIKIQKEFGTWSKEAVVTPRGMCTIILQFKGFQEAHAINDADTSLIFNV